MDIVDILNSSDKVIKENLNLLAEVYKKETGRKVCRTCPSDIQYMLLSLKHILNMTEFKFKKSHAQYKNKKGDRTTISNSTMTDEKAIEFLKTNPERIRLFSEYPSNWERLIIDGAEESEEMKEARLAAEAEAKAAAEGRKQAEENKKEETTDPESEAVKAAENVALQESLLKLTLTELREMYPDVKARSVKEFVAAVIAQ